MNAADRSILICLADEGRSLAAHLREHGLRTQAFTDMAGLMQVAAHAPPAAILADLEAVTRLAGHGSPCASPDTQLIVAVSDNHLASYLDALRAGADRVVTLPINRPFLRHHLRWQAAVGQNSRIAVIGGDDITALLRGRSGYDIHPVTPDARLLETLEALTPDLMLVDGDQTDPSGAAVMSAIRQRLMLRTPPLIAYTRGDKRILDAVAQRAGVDSIIGPMLAADLYAIIDARLSRSHDLLEARALLGRRDAETGLYRREELVYRLSELLETPATASTWVLHIALHPRDDGPSSHQAANVAGAQTLMEALPTTTIPTRLAPGHFAALLTETTEATARQLVERLEAMLQEHAPHEFSARVELRAVNANDDRVERLLAVHDPHSTQPEGRDEAQQRYWRAQVETALMQNRFHLVYQPISGLHGRPCSFYEVFLRLIGENGEEIPPREFLPALHGSALAVRLDQWVFSRAIHVLARRQSEAQEQPRLFVKLSADGLADPEFPTWLNQQLTAEAVPPSQLVIEIAATELRRPSARAKLPALTATQCGLAVEHVTAARAVTELTGVGQPDYIKLDAQLTSAEADDATRREAKTIAATARAADVRLIATCVQDAMGLASLWAIGIDYVQGHFMQAPERLFGQAESVTNHTI